MSNKVLRLHDDSDRHRGERSREDVCCQRLGPMRMVHIFHPMLIKSKGKIVNIGSVGGIVPYVYGCKSTHVSHFDYLP